MTIITRFAPSPTGALHIGSARTALFNFLYAKANNGKFLLRIEDTDQTRSTKASLDSILDSLHWLGLKYDDDIVYQSKQIKSHKQVVADLLSSNNAYKCFLTSEELSDLRKKSRKTGQPIVSPWRDMNSNCHPQHQSYVVRIRTPEIGKIILQDEIQGTIVVQNSVLEDFIVMRSDNTPTYMLAVVVDDYNMGITHVIRGDDHLNNTFKQIIIYQAMGWKLPSFAHIPLICGEDGTKLSKRHGALSVNAYKDMGYLAEAMNNYLLRLGWSYGDKEIIEMNQAIKIFSLAKIGKAPARFNLKKLSSLNSHYLNLLPSDKLTNLIINHFGSINVESIPLIKQAMTMIKERSKTIDEAVQIAKIFILGINLAISPELKNLIKLQQEAFDQCYHHLTLQKDWNKDVLFNIVVKIAKAHNIKLGVLALPLRISITGAKNSPSVFEIMSIIGQQETLSRLKLHVS